MENDENRKERLKQFRSPLIRTPLQLTRIKGGWNGEEEKRGTPENTMHDPLVGYRLCALNGTRHPKVLSGAVVTMRT
jgi:hypothetical protein